MDISDRFCDVAHTFLVAIGQKHPGSLDCEGATNCGTQALCRTSHQRPFSGKPLSHHFVSFFAQADCFERPSVTRPFDALIQSQSGGRQIRSTPVGHETRIPPKPTIPRYPTIDSQESRWYIYLRTTTH